MPDANPENKYLAALMALKPADLTPNAWTRRADVNRNFFQDLKEPSREPNPATLDKVLDAIGLSIAEFYTFMQNNQFDVPLPARAIVAPGSASVHAPTMEFRGPDRPRDIPVLGTSECADLEVSADGQTVTIDTAEIDFDEVVDHLRRPLALDGRIDIYGIYQQGHSLEPKYEAGEPAYVDAKRPPMVGDYVVVQLRSAKTGDRVARVITKRLVRNTAAFIELEQFNPPLVFRVAKSEIVRMHRIIPNAELISF